MNAETAGKWYRQAKHDLDIAEANISIGGYDVAAFLSQQAVEKLLKSVFALQGKKIPRMHYVDQLARDLHLDERIIEIAEDLAADYTFSRYPDVAEHVPFEEYDRRTAASKVDNAKAVFNEICRRHPEIQGLEND